MLSFNKKKLLSTGLVGCIVLSCSLPSNASLYKSKDQMLSTTLPDDAPLLFAALPSNRLAMASAPLMAEAPASNSLDLESLGFSKGETTQDPALQKKLDRRSKMLKTHQILGLVTGVAMALSLSKASGTGAKGEAGKDAREDHAKLGIATGVLYFTTAGFSIFAPEVPGEKASGRTKIHKALAFIHFPAMVGTMILGITDKKKLDRGEDASGLKPGFASTAAVAFYTSLAVMVIPFGGKGDGK